MPHAWMHVIEFMIYDIDMINHDIEFIDSFLQYLAARLYMYINTLAAYLPFKICLDFTIYTKERHITYMYR